MRTHLLISCPDRPGIVAAVTRFLFEHGANIVESDQYTTNPWGGTFFMRIAFDLDADRNPAGGPQGPTAAKAAFAKVAEPFHMDWQWHTTTPLKRMAVFVSKETHCLQDLLWHWKIGELPVEIALVLSNHPDAIEEVDHYGLPFTLANQPDRQGREQQQLALLEEAKVDFIVLARYMQILSSSFVEAYRHRIINIHHSFLPAFAGAKPYQQAYERGVKIVGATAHYVTEELDEGPIIEQDVARVSHKDGPQQLRRIGRSIERSVLTQAVRWHAEDRILVFGKKTVVFS